MQLYSDRKQLSSGKRVTTALINNTIFVVIELDLAGSKLKVI
jgi:hypothetical protein